MLAKMKRGAGTWRDGRTLVVLAVVLLGLWFGTPTIIGQAYENWAMLALAQERVAGEPFPMRLDLPQSTFEHFERAVEFVPANVRDWRNLGFAYVLAGKQSQAERAWRNVPDATTELLYWSTYSWNNCRCRAAIPWVQVAAAIAPADQVVDVRRQLGQMYINNEMWDEAQRELEALLVRDPTEARGLVMLASVYYVGYGDRAAANALLQQALDLPVDSAAIYFAAGELLISMADYADAQVMLERAYAITPERRDTLISLGRSLFYQRKFEEALVIFKEARALAGSDWQDSIPHFWLGRTYHGLGQLDEAIAEFQRALEWHPSNNMTYLLMGDAYAANGEFDKAAEAYRTVLARNPGNADATKRLEALP